LRYFNLGALYGASAEEAFAVDTGPQVNTLATIAAQEVHAVVRVKVSPFGEWVADRRREGANSAGARRLNGGVTNGCSQPARTPGS
jgi:hypothetical protein